MMLPGPGCWMRRDIESMSRRDRKNRIGSRILAALLAAILLLPAGPTVRAAQQTTVNVKTVPEGMMRYADYAAKNTIAPTTLFVGTYLMPLAAVTPELYTLARQSQVRHEQPISYYYSELAGGSWRNLSTSFCRSSHSRR